MLCLLSILAMLAPVYFAQAHCSLEEMAGFQSGGAENIKCQSLVRSGAEGGGVLRGYGFHLLVYLLEWEVHTEKLVG